MTKKPSLPPKKVSTEVPIRTEIAPQDQWDLEKIYPNLAAWEKDWQKIDGLVAKIEKFQHQLKTPAPILACWQQATELDRLLDRLYTYAHLRADEDTAQTTSQALYARITAKCVAVGKKLAWIEPQILRLPKSTLAGWSQKHALKDYHHPFTKLLRRKPHHLSEKIETVLAGAGEVFAASQQTFNFLTNADLRFPEITDSNGQKVALSNSRYILYLQDKDRRVRCEAYNTLYTTYRQFRNTLASTLAATIKKNNYLATLRRFPDALTMALHDDNIPVQLYDNLITTTEEALPALHNYFAYRAERLGLQKLEVYDLYTSLVPSQEVKIPYDQAKEWVTTACAPLGKDYGKIVKQAFAERWIDIYENRGKRSGAYASGCYDSQPYILLNYQGTFNDVLTLAHELGHAIHTYLANQHQPYNLARYPIFIAEIASTLNEALLMEHLLATTKDRGWRAYLINHLLDGFRGTVYRQTMFAAFEKKIYESEQAQVPLTAETIGQMYKELHDRHLGLHVQENENNNAEWSRIPHFYYNFYVYKYATSYCAAQIFAKQILEKKQTKPYLQLLRAGGAADPLPLIKKAGVDLLDGKTLALAFEGFRKKVEELRDLLG